MADSSSQPPGARGPIARMVALILALLVAVASAVLVVRTMQWLYLEIGMVGVAILVVLALLAGGDRRRGSNIDSVPYAEPWDVESVERVLRRLGGDTRGIEERLRRSTARDVSALLTLHSVLPVSVEVPSPGGWAATPQTLLALVRGVQTLPDGGTVVECGSGTSTVWMGLAAKDQGRNVKVIALEHDDSYAQQTRLAVARAGVEDFVEVRLAPLERINVNGANYEWYSADAYESIGSIDLLFVDGPPAKTGHDARFPAYPMLRGKLTRNAVVVLDDTNRRDERKIIDRWAKLDGVGVLTIDRDLDRSTVLRFARPSDA